MSDEEAQDGPVNASLDNAGGGDPLEDEEGGGGFDAKKLILFVVAPLFILAGVGAGLHFSGALDKIFAKEETHEEAGDGHGDESGHGEGHSASAVFLEIPDIIVNLSSPDGQPRYLRLSVQLELKNQMDLTAVEQVMPRVVDQFQTYLRELRVKDLRGSAGIYRLQMELLARVNAAAYPVEVEDVLFQEILIQ